jgi:hypothetical protein
MVNTVLLFWKKASEFWRGNGTTWKLVSIPFKWVPMLWIFNRVVKLPIFFVFWFSVTKVRLELWSLVPECLFQGKQKILWRCGPWACHFT